jgi:hypothetical protein
MTRKTIPAGKIKEHIEVEFSGGIYSAYHWHEIRRDFWKKEYETTDDPKFKKRVKGYLDKENKWMKEIKKYKDKKKGETK